jgi:hypothetical protein
VHVNYNTKLSHSYVLLLLNFMTDCYLMKFLLLGMKDKHMRDLRTRYEELKDVHEVLDKRRDEHNKMEAYSDTDVSPTRITGPVHLQIEAQDAY